MKESRLQNDSGKPGGWGRPLARPVGVWGGPDLRTLADARAFIFNLSDSEQRENRWQHAVKLLLEAAEQDGDAEAVTRQLEFALFMGMQLKLR